MLHSTDPKKLNKKEGTNKETQISLIKGNLKSHKRQMDGGNWVGEGMRSRIGMCSGSGVERDRGWKDGH